MEFFSHLWSSTIGLEYSILIMKCMNMYMRPDYMSWNIELIEYGMVGDKSDLGFDMGYKWRLVINYGNEIDMYDEYLVGWWNMNCIWLGRNSLNL